MMLAGRAIARNIGARRYAGVVRSGRKYLSRRTTRREITSSDEQEKMLEPTPVDPTAAAVTAGAVSAIEEGWARIGIGRVI